MVTLSLPAGFKIDTARVDVLALFDALLDNTDDGVFTLDRNLCYTSFNQRHAAFMRRAYGAEIELGRCLLDYQRATGDDEPARRNLLRALNGERFRAEASSGDAARERPYFEIWHYPLCLPDGDISGVAVIARDITDREAARAELVKSRALLNSLFQALPAGVGLTINRVLVEVNDYLCDLVGYSRAELLNQSSRLLYPSQAEYERVGEVKYAQIRQSGVGTVETQWRHKAGHLIDILLSSSPIDPADWSKGITFTAIDTTERRRAEAALHESKERFRTLYENATIGLYRTTPGGQVLMANPAAVRMLGYASLEELQQRPMADGFEPQYPREEFLERIERDGAIHGLEAVWKRRDGSLIYVRESARAVRDEQGCTLYYDGTVEDITERKLAEAAEREQRALAEALRDVAAAINSTLHLEEVFDRIMTELGRVVPNDASAIYLVSGSEARAVRWRAPAHGDQADLLELRFPLVTTRNLREMLATRQPVVIPDTAAYRGWVVYPSISWIRSYVGAPIIVNDEVIGFLEADSIQPDFYTSAHADRLMAFANQSALAVQNAQLHAHVLQHAEELEERVVERTRDLVEANLRLQELDRLKDEFISRISHELRTPLTSIRIYLDLLVTGRPDKRPHYLDILNEQAGRLQTLIEHLLDVSQLDMDSLGACLTPTDLNQLARDLITRHATRALHAGLSLQLQAEPDLPLTMTDPDLAMQAFNHLMRNALAYTPIGGQITVISRQQTADARTWITLTVTDTGPGISDRDLPHLFERFYRGEAARDYRTPGVGLGLALSRDLVHRLGGRITVESVPGAGTAFTIWLPAATGSTDGGQSA